MWYSQNTLTLKINPKSTHDFPCREMFMIGLFLFAVGAGGLRPCIEAFGGDQFVLPEQGKQLNSFFSHFYIVTNAGMLTSGFVSPILRYDC